MAKLSLICLLAIAFFACSALAANTRFSDGRYNPVLNNPYYITRYNKNRNYYDNRRFFDNFYKKYNPDVEPSQARIIEESIVPQIDGVYSYSYETENGIHGEESGSPVRINAYEQAEQVQGAYSWLSPEGVRVGVKYTADENGYHPTYTYDGVNAAQYANQPQPADVVLTRVN